MSDSNPFTEDQQARITKLREIAYRVQRVFESPARLKALRLALYKYMGREWLTPESNPIPITVGPGVKLAWLVAIHDGLVPRADNEYDGDQDPASLIFAPPYPGNSEDQNVGRTIGSFVRSLVALSIQDLDLIGGTLGEFPWFKGAASSRPRLPLSSREPTGPRATPGAPRIDGPDDTWIFDSWNSGKYQNFHEVAQAASLEKGKSISRKTVRSIIRRLQARNRRATNSVK